MVAKNSENIGDDGAKKGVPASWKATFAIAPMGLVEEILLTLFVEKPLVLKSIKSNVHRETVLLPSAMNFGGYLKAAAPTKH